MMSKKITPTRKYIRLEESAWAEIEALWEVGDATLAELELRCNVSRRTLQARFSKRGIVKGAKAAALAASVKKAVFDENVSDKEVTTSRAKDTREAAYRNAVVIEDLIMSQLEAAQKDPTQALKAASAIKALSLAAAGLERLHTLKWRALGMDSNTIDRDDLPILRIENLTTADIEEFRRNTGSDVSDFVDDLSIAPGQDADEMELRAYDTDHDDDVVRIGFAEGRSNPGPTRRAAG